MQHLSSLLFSSSYLLFSSLCSFLSQFASSFPSSTN
jgi:hypothetical protein